jgi:hypothetical protein
MHRNPLRSVAMIAAAGIGLAMLAAQPASAACFEQIGCTDNQNLSPQGLRQLSCDSLWLVRNTIFDENGYCFQTARGKATFSNAGCLYMTSAATPLNHYEQRNVDLIRKIERQKGCN